MYLILALLYWPPRVLDQNAPFTRRPRCAEDTEGMGSKWIRPLYQDNIKSRGRSNKEKVEDSLVRTKLKVRAIYVT